MCVWGVGWDGRIECLNCKRKYRYLFTGYKNLVLDKGSRRAALFKIIQKNIQLSNFSFIFTEARKAKMIINTRIQNEKNRLPAKKEISKIKEEKKTPYKHLQ